MWALRDLPVLEISLPRIKARCRNKVTEKEILYALPYIGLDIEDQEGDMVRVEYSPNRADFCSEAGIARSLLGLLGVEIGLPRYEFRDSQIRISVEGKEIRSVRPYINSLYSALSVTEDVIKQLIVMQEDLHNGVGRHRSKVAIGIHNAEMVRPPIKYLATDDDSYSFVPLNSSEKMTISEIIERTNQGREYGKILKKKGYYPLLIDSSGNTLSMPPIINGELTRLREGVRSIFVDVTSTEKNAGETTIAIIASMLSDIGGKVENVTVEDTEQGGVITTPDMSPGTMTFELDLTNRILGLKLGHEEARAALQKSRLELISNDQVRFPRFRSDIIHPIDLVEEVELGYGVSRLGPARTKSHAVGSLSARTKRLRTIVEILVGLGLIEIESLALGENDEEDDDDVHSFRVEDPKSQSYEFLRSSVIPSLLRVLSRSTHEEYPQRVFEQISVFRPSGDSDTGVSEEAHVGGAIAGSEAGYSVVRSVLDGFFRLALAPKEAVAFSSAEAIPLIYTSGRTAVITMQKGHQGRKLEVGLAGEVSPETLQRLGLRVPVAAFELNLEPLLND